MTLVTTRERIDEVLDALPESELAPLLEIIASRLNHISDGETYPTLVPKYGGRRATPEEFEAFVAQHDISPPDGEG
jgi:hypothetical protein